jgi:hypothetical protein
LNKVVYEEPQRLKARLIFTQFFRRWQMRVGYVDFALTDDDLFAHGFGDFAAVVQRQ